MPLVSGAGAAWRRAVSSGWFAAARASRPILMARWRRVCGRAARHANLAGQDVCSEPNQAPAQACPIGRNRRGGSLDSPDDVDRYRIGVGQGQVVLARLSTLPATSTSGSRPRVAHRLPRAKAAVQPTTARYSALPREPIGVSLLPEWRLQCRCAVHAG